MGIEYVLVFMIVGWVCGYTVRKFRLRKIKNSMLQKPLYAIQEELTPAEFGYLLDGKIGRREVVAEVVLLKTRGYIDFVRQPSGNYLTQTITSLPTESLSPVQQIILSKFASKPDATYIAQDAIEAAVKKNLIQKGWIPKPSYKAKIPRTKQNRYANIAAFGIIVTAGLGWLIARAAGATPETAELVFKIIIAVAVGGLVLTMLSLLLYLFLSKNAGLLLNPTPKYKQSWKDVNGVYNYLLVSGMDIFTPDYATMDFKGLDQLYPYAVAAGLDKKIVRIII